MKRAILVVLDSVGVGELQDAKSYGDEGSHTLDHVYKACNGLEIKELEKLGLGNIEGVNEAKKCSKPVGAYGRCKEASKGKDTVTGHWEIAGVILEKPLNTYPEGFSEEIIEEFKKRANVKGILGNVVASGTQIIEELGEEHVKTGYPIIYTSADSVFQIAAHEDSPEYVDKSVLNVKDILEFADTVKIEDVKEILDRQITMNSAISDEGLRHAYGAQVGRTLLNEYGDDVKIRARAHAAAGSDARMSGCSLPVVINSGSGNQGMTVSLPVIEFAKEWNVSQEKLYRALVVSNLIAVHQKKYIGSLSAYCGAVSAGCGAGAAITYLSGGSYEDVSLTIVNTIGNVGGIVCDGAKSSCAAKIASAVDAAILAHYMGQHHRSFQPGEGIVREDVEDTIKSMGYIGRVGMKDTDTEILNIMIDRVDVNKVC